MRWDEAPLPALVDSHRRHLSSASLRETLPVSCGWRAASKHGTATRRPARAGSPHYSSAIQASVLDHLEKEEEILFPTIVRGMGARAAGPVHVMEIEHEHHQRTSSQIRRSPPTCPAGRERAPRGVRCIWPCSSSSRS